MCQPSIAVAAGWGPGPISMGRLKPVLADRFAGLAKNIRKRPILVLESDIGNVAYFTDFAVLDIGGLANLEIARNGIYGPLFQHYVFEEMKPDIIHLRGNWAASANLPIALIERDYQRLPDEPAGSYAEGWYIRRDPEHPYGAMKYLGEDSQGERMLTDDFGVRWIALPGGGWRLHRAQPGPSFPSAESGAADIYAEVRRECDAEERRCHTNDALARQALARAGSFRRAGRLTSAFEWSAAAWEADRRNIVALREREDTRLAIVGQTLAIGPGGGNLCPFVLEATSVATSGGGSTGTVTLTTDTAA